MSLSDGLVREQGHSESAPGPSQGDQGPQDADCQPTQVRGITAYLLPLPVLPCVTSALRMSSQRTWRVTITRGQDSFNVYVLDDSEEEETKASTTALARAIVLERFRDRLEAL